MKKLYYSISIELEELDHQIYDVTGLKRITVYNIFNNQPTLLCEIESNILLKSVEEIQTWLDENGFENEEYEFIEL